MPAQRRLRSVEVPTPQFTSGSQLCDAASSGDRKVVRRLLAEGASVDSCDEDGTTALMAASFWGQALVVADLLAAGADPDAQDDSGMTALMHAVIACGELEAERVHPIFVRTIGLLLDHGTSLGLRDHDGLTAYDHAVVQGPVEIRSLLDR